MASATIRKGEKLKRWERKLKDPASVLKMIGAMMVAESQDAFRAQAFDGARWDERSNPNVYGIIADFAAGKKKPEKRRFESRPALVDTGDLARKITFRVEGDTVHVGTNLPYASVHQEGGPIESERISGSVRANLWKWLRTQGAERKRQLGWLLNQKFKDKTLRGRVEARPFLGITRQTMADVRDLIGVELMEVR